MALQALAAKRPEHVAHTAADWVSKESTSPDLPLHITHRFRTHNLQDPDTVLRCI